jgi:hypothetical protein
VESFSVGALSWLIQGKNTSYLNLLIFVHEFQAATSRDILENQGKKPNNSTVEYRRYRILAVVFSKEKNDVSCEKGDG